MSVDLAAAYDAVADIIRGSRNLEESWKSLIAYGESLIPGEDHPLMGPWQPSRDCHIEADWVLIYTARGDSLRLERIGTHSDLFKK